MHPENWITDAKDLIIKIQQLSVENIQSLDEIQDILAEYEHLAETEQETISNQITTGDQEYEIITLEQRIRNLLIPIMRRVREREAQQDGGRKRRARRTRKNRSASRKNRRNNMTAMRKNRKNRRN